ncbi:hypothetical protein FK220_000580 [Flavobacteriaceae bacterium TP-CH-4]|uniref:YfdX protein n=1 Tax=Pelagihabitans pacificus TaxID=2696054 RepID=A0A967AQS8_9FLAO|nr:hypothetical protein [Pelagihabitans pacificus]NHF57815.1 hypothetical protein [Pelagihabitans pacificus]
MKTIATFILVLFIGVAAQAKETTQEVKVAAVEMGIVTDIVVEQKMTFEKTTEVARLYKRRNTLVKKALSFKTKRDRAKMA